MSVGKDGISILIELPLTVLLLVDILAWLFFHMSISIFMLKVPDAYYQKRSSFYQPFAWEMDGQVWQRVVRINNWKKFLPDSSAILKKAYNKKKLSAVTPEGLEKFIVETKRAEQTHWLSILPAPLFFLWNPTWAAWIMIFYAILANLPFIIVQRYNRPRMIRLLERLIHKEKHSQKKTASKKIVSQEILAD